MNKILGRYSITYQNGVIQEKDLINHDDYESIMKPTKDLIYDLISTKDINDLKEANKLKNDLKLMFGDSWFTNKSPLYQAFHTGILSLPKSQGGNSKCIVKLINK